MSYTRAKTNIWVFIVLYIYIFNPVFAFPGFGFVNFMIGFAGIYAILYFRRFLSYLVLYKKEAFLTVLMIVYAYFRTKSPDSNAADTVSTMIIWVLSTLLVSIFLVDAFFSRQNNFVFFESVLHVAYAAAMISVLAALFPPFNSFIRSIQTSIEFEAAEHVADYRLFGLATNLSSSYGYVQGILASYCLLNLKKNSLRNTIYFLALVIATAVNARTGLIPVIITIVYLLFKERRFVIKYIIFVPIVAIFVWPLINAFINSGSPIVESIRSFFISIFAFVIKGQTNVEGGTYFSVLQDEIIFPPLEEILFGSGYTLFGAFDDLGMRSDIMYINQIFIGGVVFLAIILWYVFTFYKDMWKLSEKQFFSLLLLIMALVANFKGSAFYVGNALTRFVMLYYFVLLYNSRNVGKKIKIECNY